MYRLKIKRILRWFVEKIAIAEPKKPAYTLGALLDHVTTTNLHEETDKGKPAGSEVW